eukprot:COSAG01_NODE_8075_length_2930_cov_47.724832_2_plen_312_part_00
MRGMEAGAAGWYVADPGRCSCAGLEAKQKLAERRAKLRAKQKSELLAAGASEDEVEGLMVELSEADEEGDEHKEQLEQELDNDEVQLADSKRRQLERGLADAGDDEAKKKELTDAFNADMKASAEKLAADREAKRAALAARLAKRKAAVEAKIDNALGESVELGTIAKQKQERASLEEEEEDSASKTAAGELMASYTKDNDELSRARRAKREAAQQKLQARRAKLAEKHKKELANAGVPEEVAAEIVKQEEETADKEFKQREAQEEQMDKKHAEEAKAEESALQAKLKAAEEVRHLDRGATACYLLFCVTR